MKIGFFIVSLNAYHAHIKPFIDYLSDADYSFVIFHLNNLYTPEFSIDELPCSTVSLSKMCNIKKILCYHSIDFMVFINPGSLFDLFLIACCKQLNITTIYYQHGIQLDFSSFNPNSLNRNKTLKAFLIRIKKYFYIYFFILNNIFFFKRAKNILKTVTIKTLHLLNKKNKNVLPKYGLKFMHIDYAFVYGKLDKKYLISSMDMCNKNIILSGYPFIQQSEKLKFLSRIKYILYISSGLRKAGVIPIAEKEEREFYLNINEIAFQNNFKLIIKIHPQENIKLFEKNFENNKNIIVYKHKNLADLTINSECVLGDYSTALFYAIKYYKPILIIRNRFFHTYPFDLTKYDIGKKIDLTNLDIELKRLGLTRYEKKKYQDFLHNHLLSPFSETLYKIFYDHLEKIRKA